MKRWHGRAALQIADDYVVKEFTDPDSCERERRIYEQFPQFCPRLLDATDSTLTIERLPVAVDDPTWRPVEATIELLEALNTVGLHHRDAHVKNLVRGPDGPLLIDWETAVVAPGVPSYDLYGPDVSGVPSPTIHKGWPDQYWGTPTRFSFGRWWNHELPGHP